MRRFRTVASLSDLSLIGLACYLSIALLPHPAPAAEPIAQSRTLTLIQQGDKALASGDDRAALKLWLDAFKQQTGSADRRMRSILHYRLGVATARLGNLPDGMRHLEHALALARQINDQSTTAQALNVLGLIASQQGDHAKAISTQTAYLQLPASATSPQGIAMAQASLGVAYHFLNKQAEALQHLSLAHQALRLLPKGKDNVEVMAKVESHLSNLYYELGAYEQAIKWQQQSLTLAKAINSPELIAGAYNSLGSFAYEKRDFAQAASLFSQGLAIAKTLHRPRLEATLHLNLGKVAHILGNHQDANKNLLQAASLAQDLNDPMLLGEIHSARGLLRSDQGHYEQALVDYGLALQEFERSEASENRAIALNNRAHTHLRWRQLNAAERDLLEALAILDKRRAPLTDRLRISLFNTQVSSYNLLQQVLIADQRIGDGLLASERGRAQAFLAQLANQQQITEAPPSLESLRAIARAQQATIVEYSLIPEDRFIHQGRSQGEAAQIYIWVLQPSGAIHFQPIDLKQKGVRLQHLIQQARELITTPSTLAKPDQPLRLLHQLLIEPIARWLPKDPRQTVVFVPQQGLFLLPFAALRDQDGRDLIDHHTILTAPSIQALDPALHRRRPTPVARSHQGNLEALFVGNPRIPSQLSDLGLLPLRGSQAEAERLREKFFPSHSTILVGRQATETAIKQLMPSARIIHLAAHGLLATGQEPSIPSSEDLRRKLSNGAIVLSESSQDDGLLTYDEVIQLPLRADLVVLSACDTGRGEITGDGVVGLSRAFLGAGVPSVVVSLWKIPDQETSQLMESFYQFSHHSKVNQAQALRLAMLNLKQTEPDPLAWAGFTLVGTAH